jgi:hypothetical protein
MSPGAIRSVYTVANDMDLMQAFYEGALELPLVFRDRDNWCQFKAGPVSFALSSPSEAAKGARQRDRIRRDRCGCVRAADRAAWWTTPFESRHGPARQRRHVC